MGMKKVFVRKIKKLISGEKNKHMHTYSSDQELKVETQPEAQERFLKL